MEQEITTWYFEMKSQDQLKQSKVTPDLEVKRLDVALPSFHKFVWMSVGVPWQWWERLSWTDEQWLDSFNQETIDVYVGFIGATPAGFFELRREDNGDMQILYFGLLPEFIGKGYGGHLLSEAITTAWNMGTERVWVHTCTLDGPNAVANYKARGFVQYDEKVAIEDNPYLD